MQKLASESSARTFALGPQNDTSLVLDLLRALAAQMVCVGHAINLSGVGYTFAPHIGVMLFFVLSGFVIAHTLTTKSADPSYDIRAYGLERFARIYCAYLPAIVLIGIVDNLMAVAGRPIAAEADATWAIWLKNVFMLQGHPSQLGVTTYGSAGHLTSLAVEFHIYFFVGGFFFFLIGRSRIAAAFLVLAASKMALGYFLAIPGSDRALFVLWLLGFAAYFTCGAVVVDRVIIAVGLTAAPLLAIYWLTNRVPGQEYDIANYPIFALAFLALALGTQGSRWLASHERSRNTVRFLADYSFSLFLVHLVVVKVMFALAPWQPVILVTVAVMAANAVAISFALLFERRYRQLADALKRAVV